MNLVKHNQFSEVRKGLRRTATAWMPKPLLLAIIMIAVVSCGGDGDDPVSPGKSEPRLAITPAKLEFGISETNKTYIISNGGEKSLSWDVSDNKTWITVSPVNGSTTTETDQVTVTVNRSGLGAGSYSGMVIVSSNGGRDTVNISMLVSADPQLCVSPDRLDFGSSETSKPFSITNCGNGGTLSWSVSDNKSWISVSPTSGNTTNGTAQVTVNVNRSGLGAGSYSGMVIVSSNGGGDTVNISMQVSCNLSVTDPNSGRVWQKGDRRSILWTPGAGNVKIELFKESRMRCTIKSSTVNDGSYSWIVDDCNGGTSADYQIKITSLSNTSCYDYSDMFTILVPETTWCEVVADAPVYQEVPGTNFNGNPNTVGWSSANNEIRSQIKFDLSNIPQNAKISEAYLHLFASSCIGCTVYWKVNLANRSWNESTVTWNNSPGRISPESTFQPPKYVQWYKYRLVDHVKAWVENGYYNYGIVLSPSSASNGMDWIAFGDNSHSNLKPRLEVVYIAQP